jgi:hypothetical protein
LYVKVKITVSLVWTTVVIVPGGYNNFPVLGSVKFTLAAGTTVGFGLNSVEVNTHTVVDVAGLTDNGRGC